MATDRDASFTDFVVDQRERLLRTAYLLCGDWNRAEDVTQVALSKLYRAWGRVHQSREAYARRIIARTVIDDSRRPWRREAPIASPHDGNSYSDRSDQVADRLRLDQALRQLPMRQRQVVVLRHYWGLSVSEVAEELDISPGSVKTHRSRAIERLSELLDPHAPEVRPR